MAPSNGFRVDPDKLLAVADRVKALLADVSGGSGVVLGNSTRYADHARADSLRAALAPFWNGEDVFANAYEAEHTGINVTFTNMTTQLTTLERACRSTAEKYKAEDGRTSTEVKNTDPGTR